MTDEKIKFLMRIDPDTDRKIKAAMPLANCRSQNEFVEKALQFYCDYVASQDCFSVLPPMLIAALRATVQGSENHICRLLFKLAVEMDMMMNVLAAAMEIPEEQLCIREVVLIKAEPKQAQMEAFEQAVADFGGRCQIVEGGVYVIELTDTPDSINYFIEELQVFHIREISRTGGVALELSRETVY